MAVQGSFSVSSVFGHADFGNANCLLEMSELRLYTIHSTLTKAPFIYSLKLNIKILNSYADVYYTTHWESNAVYPKETNTFFSMDKNSLKLWCLNI